jgi:hypothetical protein
MRAARTGRWVRAPSWLLAIGSDARESRAARAPLSLACCSARLCTSTPCRRRLAASPLEQLCRRGLRPCHNLLGMTQHDRLPPPSKVSAGRATSHPCSCHCLLSAAARAAVESPRRPSAEPCACPSGQRRSWVGLPPMDAYCASWSRKTAAGRRRRRSFARGRAPASCAWPLGQRPVMGRGWGDL